MAKDLDKFVETTENITKEFQGVLNDAVNATWLIARDDVVLDECFAMMFVFGVMAARGQLLPFEQVKGKKKRMKNAIDVG